MEHVADRNDSPVKEGDTATDTPASDRSEINGNHDQAQGSSSGKQVQDDGIPPGPDADVPLPGGFGSLGVLTGLLQSTDPTGMGNGAIPDSGLSDGFPTDFRARLAGDIAAGFSNRNGIQTLVLKLDSEHLGQVDVKLQAKADHLTVRLLAANRDSEAALRGNIKELSEAIQKRTGRFQQVEVRVELKGNEETGQKSAEGDPGHSPDRDSGENGRESQDSGREQDNPNTEKLETEPGNWAEGG